jgi:hypothetical protein
MEDSLNFPPEAYLIGAQKAGTTTLAYLLDQHPRVAVSQPKEPHFFTHNWGKGLHWYKARFPDSLDLTLVDASTSYSMAPLPPGKGGSQAGRQLENVPERVFSVNPKAKFIYLLRDPVERTYSGYWHSVRTGREGQGFRAAFQSKPFYLDISDYYGQLSLWLNYFPLDSFLFVLFEDLKESAERTTKECFEFLGVGNDAPSVRFDSAKNPSFQNGQVGRKINRLLIEYPFLSKHLGVLRPLVPEVIRDRVRGTRAGFEPIPEMEEEDKHFLVEYFRERNRRLECLIGIPLDKWQG